MNMTLAVLILLILWCIETLYVFSGHKVLRKKMAEQSKLDYDDPQVGLWLEIIFSKPSKKVYTGRSYTK
jgi:hypothetical protein